MSDGRPFEPWRWEIPERFNIGAACTDRHLGTPVAARVAMIIEDDSLGPAQLTFEELSWRTSRFGELLKRLGIVPGDRLLIRLPNSLAYPTAFLGGLKCGAICVPTSTLLTQEEVEYVATDSGATALVIDKTAWRQFALQLARVPTLKQVILVGSGEIVAAGGIGIHDLEPALESIESWSEPCSTGADDPAYLVYTSGTTSYPKASCTRIARFWAALPRPDTGSISIPTATGSFTAASSTGRTCWVPP